MSKPTNCMNDKCLDLQARSNHPEREISTFWYECAMDIEDAKDCKEGVSVCEFEKKKPKKRKVKYHPLVDQTKDSLIMQDFKENMISKIKCPRCWCTENDGGITTEDGLVYTCSQYLNRYNANCVKSEFTIKDSGKRVKFSTGMIRDSEEKIRYDLIPIWFLERFAEHLTKGAKKYEPRNWELAETEEELERFIQSAWRHFIALLRNETEEDHMAALAFNICGIELVREKLKNKLNKE